MGMTNDESRQAPLVAVLFMDIVGFSTLPNDQQLEVRSRLEGLVQSLPSVRDEPPEALYTDLRAGDSKVLVFFGNLKGPVDTALSLRDAMGAAAEGSPRLDVRMGLHCGPVVIDPQGVPVGEALNLAQRVASCGAPGDILASDAYARALRADSSRYLGLLGPPMSKTVKHGVRMLLVPVGRRHASRRASRWYPVAAFVLLAALFIWALWPGGLTRATEPAETDPRSSSPQAVLQAIASTRDAVAEPLSRPDLTAGGLPLVVSNSPERLTNEVFGDAPAVALYRTSIPARRFHLFLHHSLEARGPVEVGIAITNQSPVDIQVYLGPGSPAHRADGSGLIRLGAADSPDPALAGNEALWNWLTALRRGTADTWSQTVKPGESGFLLAGLSNGSCTSWNMDVAVRFEDDQDPRVPTAILTVIAFRNQPGDPLKLPIAAPEQDRDGLLLCRGSFASSERRARIPWAVDEPRWIDLAGPTIGQFSRPLGQEYLNALDDPKMVNRGNYGVLYDLDLQLENPGKGPTGVIGVVSAAGGRGRPVVEVDGVSGRPESVLAPHQAWMFHRWTVPGGASLPTRVRLSLPGGSSGPQRLYLWPVPP